MILNDNYVEKVMIVTKAVVFLIFIDIVQLIKLSGAAGVADANRS